MKNFFVVLFGFVVMVQSRPDMMNNVDRTYLPPNSVPMANDGSEIHTEIPSEPEIVTSKVETSTEFSMGRDDITEKALDKMMEVTTPEISDDSNAFTTMGSNEIETNKENPPGVYLPPHDDANRGDTNEKGGSKDGNMIIPGKTKSGKGLFDVGEGNKDREGHSNIPDQSNSSPGQDYFQFDSPSKYKFGYEVNHPESMLNFGHHESRDEDTVTGRYFVLLPDGRKQIVEYVADNDGYHPKIRYESPMQNMIQNYNVNYNDQSQGMQRSVGVKDYPYSRQGHELVGNPMGHLPEMGYY